LAVWIIHLKPAETSQLRVIEKSAPPPRLIPHDQSPMSLALIPASGLLDHPQLGRFGRLQMDDPDRQGLCTRLCEAQEPHRYQYRRDVQVLSPIPRGNKIPALIRKCRDFSCPQPRSRLSRAG
jgi:hypothetical protein